jgi:hypothetical protein
MKTHLVPMPSPSGRNRENLYAPAAWFPRNPTAAYDSRRGLDAQPESSKADQVAKRLVDTLSQDELAALGNAVCRARDAKYGGGARDEEASLDPNATRQGVNGTLKQKANLNGAQDANRRRIAQDARWTSALTGAFARPGSKTYDQRERKKMAADAAVKKSLFERFPDIARIGVQPLETDPHARPHSMAIDSRRVASLEERYPGISRIGLSY